MHGSMALSIVACIHEDAVLERALRAISNHRVIADMKQIGQTEFVRLYQ
jgi:hypothetical protein